LPWAGLHPPGGMGASRAPGLVAIAGPSAAGRSLDRQAPTQDQKRGCSPHRGERQHKGGGVAKRNRKCQPAEAVPQTPIASAAAVDPWVGVYRCPQQGQHQDQHRRTGSRAATRAISPNPSSKAAVGRSATTVTAAGEVLPRVGLAWRSTRGVGIKHVLWPGLFPRPAAARPPARNLEKLAHSAGLTPGPVPPSRPPAVRHHRHRIHRAT